MKALWSAPVVGLMLFSVALPAAVASGPASHDLSVAGRTSCQRAIEAVYWNHRIWPEVNPSPKPSIDQVVPESALRAKVEDVLAKAAVLRMDWKSPVTSAELKAELDRMARGTRDPAMLRELFAALGNDPVMVAECLARPVLVDRLIHQFYARDTALHRDTRRAAEQAIASVLWPSDLRTLGTTYIERTYVRSGSATTPNETAEGGVTIAPDEWDSFISAAAAEFGGSSLGVGRISALREDDERFYVVTVLASRADSVTLGTAQWLKQGFDAWWAARQDRLGMVPNPPPVSLQALPAVSDSGCTNDTWRSLPWGAPSGHRDQTAVWTGAEMIIWGGSTADGANTQGGRYTPATDTWQPTSTQGVPVARWHHTAVWTGTEMIIWGGADPLSSSGLKNTGARYNPASDTWSPTRVDATAPSARQQHTAIWTGSEMIVWGGKDGSLQGLQTGGRYTPASDSWTPTTTTNAPSGRFSHVSVWTGSRMIVWGGTPNDSSALNTGGRYDPATDAWAPTSTGSGTPAGRAYFAGVWSGTELIVWGGSGYQNTGGRYNPTTDSWRATSTGVNTPDGRTDHTAIWTGTEMIVWGGQVCCPKMVATGGRYNPMADSWQPVSTDGAPVARRLHTAIWTGTQMIVWGGTDNSGIYNTGGRYSPASDSWTPTSTGDGYPSARRNHTAVWSGSEMLVYGGVDGSLKELGTGGRYSPATDSWSPMRSYDAVQGHTAVWTGTRMIAWGGYVTGMGGPYEQNSGGQYDPVTNQWSPTSRVNCPRARSGHKSVWTGTRMIVWGGLSYWDTSYNTGGVYDPAADAWSPTSTGMNVPSPRTGHAVAWTGSEMLVWGGYDGSLSNAGGRYSPATDSWAPISSGPGAPSPRSGHTAVWTGDAMLVWGGSDAVGPVSTGAFYVPASDSWGMVANAPDPRSGHTAVWTGAEMLVWGGNAGQVGSGARYDFAHDAWSPISTGQDAATSQSKHTAVYTGTEMIIWGGSGQTSPLGTGSRYCSPPPGTWYPDADRDGFGVSSGSVTSPTQPAGYVANTSDCDDADASMYPRAAQLCDAKNNVCDDPAWPGVPQNETDRDGDGFVPCAPWIGSAPAILGGSDCDDGDARVHPGAVEVCDGKADNCSAANWPTPPSSEVDHDADGYVSCTPWSGSTPGILGGADCNDNDMSVWAIPGEVGTVTFKKDKATLTWLAPAAPGTTTPLYDTIRSDRPSDFKGRGFCLDWDNPAQSLIDPDTPPARSAYFYVIRATDSCGDGTPGTKSDGVTRVVRACP